MVVADGASRSPQEAQPNGGLVPSWRRRSSRRTAWSREQEEGEEQNRWGEETK